MISCCKNVIFISPLSKNINTILIRQQICKYNCWLHAEDRFDPFPQLNWTHLRDETRNRSAAASKMLCGGAMTAGVWTDPQVPTMYPVLRALIFPASSTDEIETTDSVVHPEPKRDCQFQLYQFNVQIAGSRTRSIIWQKLKKPFLSRKYIDQSPAFLTFWWYH